MPPILHIMRHGQGYHSTLPEGHNIRDPSLTPLGESQCHTLCQTFPHHSTVDLLLASPLRRALQTCHLSFSPVIARGLKILALPIAEEASSAPSDTGREPEVLRQEFPPELVDFDHVKHGWWVHEGEYATDPAALNARAAKLRRFIRDRMEREVVLVSHGFFNHYLTGDVDDQGKQTTAWWRETELRTFRFVEGDGDEARIEETEESVLGRRGTEERVEGLVNRPSERGEGGSS